MMNILRQRRPFAKLGTKEFGSVDIPNDLMTGKSGKVRGMPHFGAHQYNPRLEPKLFSEVEESRDLETIIE